MRVPIPIVIFLGLAVVSGTWWFWTKDYDFLSSPSEIRTAEFPQPSTGPVVETDGPATPATVSGETTPSPEISEYLSVASEHPDQLPAQAAALEKEGEIQRALLAHERIIDSTAAAPELLATTLQAIHRLHAQLPLWNSDPEKALPLTLNAGTAGENAERIEPAVEKLAAEISAASSGILHVQPQIHRGNEPLAGLPPPVAIWLAGADDANTTPVLSFTLEEDEDALAAIADTLVKILQGEAARESPPFHIPAIRPASDARSAILPGAVTRLVWKTVGTRLNPARP